MHFPPLYRLIPLAALVTVTSCTSLNITNYYHRNKANLDNIEQVYQKACKAKPFSIEFTDRPFRHVSLELTTDTLTYIYEYTVGEPRMQDTLRKYGYDTLPINHLITEMQSMESTWINPLDYYADPPRHSLIYISLWPRIFNSPFVNKKYYILTYFAQPQYFDGNGNLMTGRRLRRIRKINGEVFKKINDRVCYTISAQFR